MSSRLPVELWDRILQHVVQIFGIRPLTICCTEDELAINRRAARSLYKCIGRLSHVNRLFASLLASRRPALSYCFSFVDGLDRLIELVNFMSNRKIREIDELILHDFSEPDEYMDDFSEACAHISKMFTWPSKLANLQPSIRRLQWHDENSIDVWDEDINGWMRIFTLPHTLSFPKADFDCYQPLDPEALKLARNVVSLSVFVVGSEYNDASRGFRLPTSIEYLELVTMDTLSLATHLRPLERLKTIDFLCQAVRRDRFRCAAPGL